MDQKIKYHVPVRRSRSLADYALGMVIIMGVFFVLFSAILLQG